MSLVLSVRMLLVRKYFDGIQIERSCSSHGVLAKMGHSKIIAPLVPYGELPRAAEIVSSDPKDKANKPRFDRKFTVA